MQTLFHHDLSPPARMRCTSLPEGFAGITQCMPASRLLCRQQHVVTPVRHALHWHVSPHLMGGGRSSRQIGQGRAAGKVPALGCSLWGRWRGHVLRWAEHLGRLAGRCHVGRAP